MQNLKISILIFDSLHNSKCWNSNLKYCIFNFWICHLKFGSFSPKFWNFKMKF